MKNSQDLEMTVTAVPKVPGIYWNVTRNTGPFDTAAPIICLRRRWKTEEMLIRNKISITPGNRGDSTGTTGFKQQRK